jgi:phosphoacetylglucosamine mutase
MGNMLASDWESYATMLANAEDDQLVIKMNDIIHAEKIDMETPANVVVGRDTRPRLVVRVIKVLAELHCCKL